MARAAQRDRADLLAARPATSGDKPSDMPVQAPTKYELVLNLKTAKGLGLPLPPSLLAGAIERGGGSFWL